jgi:plastocyanin
MGPRRGRSVVAVVAILGLLAVGGPTGVAQSQEAEPPAHPAHVHAGTCAELDPSPAFPLADVSPVPEGTEASEPAGAESGIPVEQSLTTIEVSLDELLADPYAINVHESADNLDSYLACGDIGGAVLSSGDDEGRELVIGLREQSGSGYSGVARLLDGADGTTTITVFLAQDLAAAGAPEAEADGEEEVTVHIVDFAFEPATITVEVGTTVTWINDGPTDHTSTAYEGGDKIWDSEILSAGQTYSYTFEEAGSFPYLCALHPSMTAQLEVVS